MYAKMVVWKGSRIGSYSRRTDAREGGRGEEGGMNEEREGGRESGRRRGGIGNGIEAEKRIKRKNMRTWAEEPRAREEDEKRA